MTSPQVLILHGYRHHRPDGHWLRWLEAQLKHLGIPVHYPQLPDADHPVLDAWLDVAFDNLAGMVEGERVIVAHSLGTALWHHAVASGASAERVLMAAPPSHDILSGDLASFALGSLDESAVGRAAPTTVVGRERDPYRGVTLHELAGGWDAQIIELSGEGHINIDDGHGPFAFALEWVIGRV